MLRFGQPGEPLAELTRVGWVLMCPRKETKINKLMRRKNCMDDYDYDRLDVLCATDIVRDDITVHQDFKN